jgi:hypothetical protein
MMRPILILIVISQLVSTAPYAVAQDPPAFSNQQLYDYGQEGWNAGNCVRAARYWFAFLLRKPQDLRSQTKTVLEHRIATCDKTPSRFAGVDSSADAPTPKTQRRCVMYAEIASAQYHASELARCNYTGPKWKPESLYHYNWCMTVQADDARKEIVERQAALDHCVR